MGEVLYSASPFQTFLGSFGMIAFFFALGLGGLGFALFRRNEGALARVASAGAAVVLLLSGVVVTFITLNTMRSGAQTIAIHVNDKLIARDNCGDGNTCERYVLETQAGTQFFDVQVNRATYEKAQIGACYELTYYPGRSILGGSEYGSSYQYVSNITKLAVASPAACQ